MLLKPLEAALNRALSLDPEVEAALAPVVGRRIAIRVLGAIPLDVTLAIGERAIGISSGHEDGAEVVLSGTPSALASLVRAPGGSLPASCGVTVQGDVALLGRMRTALARLRPDWEEPLARLFGDTAGPPVARGLRALGGALARAVRELRDDAGEYLREESGLVAERDAVETFCTEVDRLRDATERLEKRLDQLERGLG